MAKIHASHETEIARLAGARMVLCSEVNEDDRFDEAKVKQLTGGDTLTARFMQQDHFSFTPTHHLWLMGNHQPAVRAGGRSFWRRLRLIVAVKGSRGQRFYRGITLLADDLDDEPGDEGRYR
jgi:putative DNA primase/helicase